MPHRKPSVAGAQFLVLLVARLALPGVLGLAHDVLPRRLPWADPHHGGG